MSSWYDGVLEINDIKDYQHDFQGMIQISINDDKLKYFTKAMGNYVVYKYLCLDCSCNVNNLYSKKLRIYKNCFISEIKLDKSKGLIISFIGTDATNDEYNNIIRGIKLNKLKKKIKSTV